MSRAAPETADEAGATPRGEGRGELSNLRFALVFTVPVLVFLLLVIAYPLGYALYLSFHDVRFFGGFSATWIGLENYQNVLSDRRFLAGFWISVRFTVGTVILTLAIGMLLALVARDLRGRWVWLRAFIILPWAVSPYGAGILFSFLGRGQTGVGTGLAAAFGSDASVNFISRAWVVEYLALGAAWNMAPLVAFFLLANMLTTPQRLYDLARLDRMSRFETFLHVTLPPLRFTLFVFTCIIIVLSLKTFDYIFTATQGGPGNASSVLTYVIYRTSFQSLDLGYGAAMSFYLLALLIGSTMLIFVTWGRVESRR